MPFADAHVSIPQWAIDNGGLATEQSYPYLMQDHWCQAGDVSSGVALRGYVNVTQVRVCARCECVHTCVSGACLRACVSVCARQCMCECVLERVRA